MHYIEAGFYVLFGMVAGWPIFLLLLSTTKYRQQHWRVVDSTCQHIGDKHA